MPLPQPRRIEQRQPHEIARARDRGFERHSLRQTARDRARQRAAGAMAVRRVDPRRLPARDLALARFEQAVGHRRALGMAALDEQRTAMREHRLLAPRSEEHTSELQSLMRISY